MDSPQAIFTSFKLPKPFTTPSSSKDMDQNDSNDEWPQDQGSSVSLPINKYEINNIQDSHTIAAKLN